MENLERGDEYDFLIQRFERRLTQSIRVAGKSGKTGIEIKRCIGVKQIHPIRDW